MSSYPRYLSLITLAGGVVGANLIAGILGASWGSQDKRTDAKNEKKIDPIIFKAEGAHRGGRAKINDIEFQIVEENISFDAPKDDYNFEIKPSASGNTNITLLLKIPTELANRLDKRSSPITRLFNTLGSDPAPKSIYLNLSFTGNLLLSDLKTLKVIPSPQLKDVLEEMSNRFQAAAKDPKVFQTPSAAR